MAVKRVRTNLKALSGFTNRGIEQIDLNSNAGRWLQNNNPEVPGLVYKMAPMDEKMRKLNNVHKLWKAVLELTPIIDVFKDEVIKRDGYDV